jgi:hypothetical protein
MKYPLVISISEFVEPRDHGEICVTLGEKTIARKSNISLYGSCSLVTEFIADYAEVFRQNLDGGLKFENVDPDLVERITKMLRQI